MTERRQTAKTPKPQSAATPKPRARKRTGTKAQRAATPSSTARSTGQARQSPPIPASVLEHFGGQETVDLIVAECVPPDASAGDVLRLLLEARRLGAEPLRGDVYLARAPSRDGAGIGYTVAAKRDCLLRYAISQTDFMGHDERAIFEKDTFTHGEGDGDANTLAKRAGIAHSSAMPGARGKIVGAWCAAEMRGEPPTVRVLAADDYVGTEEERNQLDPDDPKRTHPDLCMIAAAMSNALRIATSLNDVIGAEELSKRPEPLPHLEAPVPVIFEEGPVDELDARIIDAYRQAQALDAMLWPPAKLSAHLASAKARAAEAGDGEARAYELERNALAAAIERDVQIEQARRRDPIANARRLAELRAFDPSDLDEDARREYDTERGALEQDERDHAPATA
jgi:hypothetical protein